MGIDFYIGRIDGLIESETRQPLALKNDACYWFLYRYFEAANLDRTRELIDLHGGGTLAGYQLQRLEDELKTALLDIAVRPETWSVFVGWNGKADQSTEIWQPLEKREAISTIERLLGLLHKARDSNTYLAYQGD